MSRAMAVVLTGLIDDAQKVMFDIATPEALDVGLRPAELRHYTDHYVIVLALQDALKAHGGNKRYSRFMSDGRRSTLLNSFKVRYGDRIQHDRTSGSVNLTEAELFRRDAAYVFMCDAIKRLGKKPVPKASNKPATVGGHWIH